MSNRFNGIFVVLVILAGAAVGLADPINFSTLSYVSSAVKYDFGSPYGLGARLTDNNDPNGSLPPAGAVWTYAPVSVRSGFSISFDFQMSGPWGSVDPWDGFGGDGFAFVIQNQGNGALGKGAGGIGYMGITNSLAVEYDTWWNRDYYADPDGNHISVHSLGPLLPNMPHHQQTGVEPELQWIPKNPDLGTASVARRLNDGEIQSSKIVYEPGFLSVYLNGANNALLSVPLKLDDYLTLTADGSAYIGFTAGTRYAYETHDILSADFTPVPEPSSWLLLCAGLAALTLVLPRRFPH